MKGGGEKNKERALGPALPHPSSPALKCHCHAAPIGHRDACSSAAALTACVCCEGERSTCACPLVPLGARRRAPVCLPLSAPCVWVPACVRVYVWIFIFGCGRLRVLTLYSD